VQPDELSRLFGTQQRLDKMLGLDQFRQYSDKHRKMSRMLQDSFGTSTQVSALAEQVRGLGTTAALADQLKATLPPGTGQQMRQRALESFGTPNLAKQIAQMPKVTMPDSYLDVMRKQTSAFQASAAYKQLLSTIDLGVSDDLVKSVRAYWQWAEAEVSAEAEDAGSDAVLEAILAQRHAITICLRRVAETMTAMDCFGVVRLPDVVLGLLIVFYVLSEVANEILDEGDEAEAA
jgi:hypothetical protein